MGSEVRRGAGSARSPLWARLFVVFGAVLMFASGGALVTGQLLLNRYNGAVQTGNLLGDAGRKANDGRVAITGPLNILMIGVDPRPDNPDEPPHSDSIMIMHVTKEMDRGYLFSIPRDTVVDIPRFAPAGYEGGRGKITDAMAFGSHVPNSPHPSREQGAQLVTLVLKQLIGITFDAAAIIDFSGFQNVVHALGGVYMCVDVRTESIHKTKDNKTHVYEPGCRHMEAWEVLDYVRQRKTLPGGDYDRQRHQQQFIKAMMKQATSSDVITNPAKLDAVIKAGAGSLTVDLPPGQKVSDWAFSLRNLKSDSVLMFKIPGSGIGVGDGYEGERLDPVAEDLFRAVREERLDEFAAAHQDLVNPG